MRRKRASNLQVGFKLRNHPERGFLFAVSKLKLFTKFWLPVIFWAGLIITASGDRKSVHHSSRIIEPLVRWLIPDISDEAVHTTVFVVRKGAHVTEFAIFALLLWRVARAMLKKESPGWSWRAAS